MNATPPATDIEFWRLARQLYLDVCTLPLSEQLAFLESAGADGELIAAVQHLLRRQDEATTPGIVIEPGALANVFVAALDRVEQASAPTQGEFRIERVLGEGGMGRVYLAVRETGGVVQRVALKVVPTAAGHPRLAGQLRRERAILASLEHPHIARLIDTGELPDGRPFFAMEYVDGVPLLSYCNAAQLDVRARLALFLRICEAVTYAHGQLVLHRDLKDSNILVDAAGRPRLLDFGIAKSLTDTRHTTQGHNHFSLRAAAPEQVRGDATTVATDVYGLGCVLYELLSGRLPFDQAHADSGHLLRSILEQPPPLASVAAGSAPDDTAARQRSLAHAGAHAAALRGDLDAVVARALRKDPAERYPSVGHLAADLRHVLAQRPIAERASERWYRVRMALRRNRLTAAVAGVLGLAIIATTALSVVQSLRAAQERDRAVAALETAKLQRDHAQQVTDFLVNAFQSADREGLTRNLTAVQLLDNAATALERDSNLAPPLRVTLAQTLAHLFFLLQNKTEAIRLGDVARREASNPADMPHEVRVRQFLVDAETAFFQNRFEDSVESAGQGLQLAGEAAQYGDGEVLHMLWEIRLRALTSLGNNAQAIETADTAIAQLSHRSDLRPDHFDWLRLHRARAAYSDGRTEEYRQQLLQLIAEQRQQDRVAGASHIRALADLAHAYKSFREDEMALPLYEEALARQLEYYGEDHPMTARLLGPMGSAYIGVGRKFEGLQLMHRMVSIVARSTGKIDNYTANGYFYLGESYLFDMQDRASAEYFVRKAMAACPPEARGNFALYERRLALLLSHNSQWFEAAYHSRHATDVLVEKFGQTDSSVESAIISTAYVDLRRFDLESARAPLSGWLLRDVRQLANIASARRYFAQEAREATELSSVFGWSRDSDGSTVSPPLRL